MVNKICSSHLELLYEYLKTNNVDGVKEIEHTLSGHEECVACAYAIKAGGAGKAELVNYLSNKGFLPKGTKATRGKTMPFWFGSLIIALPVSILAFLLIRPYFDITVSVFLSILVLVLIFLLFNPFGKRKFFR